MRRIENVRPIRACINPVIPLAPRTRLFCGGSRL